MDLNAQDRWLPECACEFPRTAGSASSVPGKQGTPLGSRCWYKLCLWARDGNIAFMQLLKETGEDSL